MPVIRVYGKILNYVAADPSESVIRTQDGKYYQKDAKGTYKPLKNGESIFNATKKNTAAAQSYNKSKGFVPNKKYYVKGNSSYFTMVDANYNTLYYRDTQRITKEEFLKGANCVYDAKGKQYVAKDANTNLHKYAEKYRQKVEDSKTGRYYIVANGGKRKYFEANGKEISERAFLDTEKAYIDSNGKIAKYDWKAKASKACEGIGDMFADMFTSKHPIYKTDKNGNVIYDQSGRPIVERNKDGSVKTKRKFDLGKTCTTVLVGAALGAAVVFAGPIVAGAATFLGASAGTAGTLAAGAAFLTKVGIGGYFAYNGSKQMYDAEKRNQNVLLSNNEKAENWKDKGAGSAQVTLSLTMAKGKGTSRAKIKTSIETENNVTLASKGKVNVLDRATNAWKGTKKANKAPVTRNEKTVEKQKTSSTQEAVKHPVKTAKQNVQNKLQVAKQKVHTAKEAAKHPVKTVRTAKDWVSQGKQETLNLEFPKDANARVAQYESLIENTTNKSKNAALLETLKSDKVLKPEDKSVLARKFFEHNKEQYTDVVENLRIQDAETGLKNAKSTTDLSKVDKEALSEKQQKAYDTKKTKLEKQEIKKASSEELAQMNRESLTSEGKKAYDAKKAKLEKKSKKSTNKKSNKTKSEQSQNQKKSTRTRIKNGIGNVKTKVRHLFKKESKSTTEKATNETKALETENTTEQNVTVNNNQSELHRITKNSNEPNNPNKIATKNSVGRLNDEKFQQVKKEFAEEVDNITSLEDANINVLRQRTEAFGYRAQRRELEKLLNDKLKKLETKQEAPQTPKQTSTTKHAYTRRDVNRFQNKINNAKTFEELNSTISELQNEGFFKKAQKQQIESVNKSIQTKRVNLEKNIEVSGNIRTKSNPWTYEDILTEIKQLETDLKDGKSRTMREVKEQLSHQNENYRKLPDEVKADLHNRITSLDRKFTEKAVENIKQNSKATEAELNAQKAANEAKSAETDFSKMIEDSTDMSEVRAKLSNNPEFNKLSTAEKRDIIGKINKREAELENHIIENAKPSKQVKVNKQDNLLKTIGKQIKDSYKEEILVASSFYEKFDIDNYLYNHPEDFAQVLYPAEQEYENMESIQENPTEENIENTDEITADDTPESAEESVEEPTTDNAAESSEENPDGTIADDTPESAKESAGKPATDNAVESTKESAETTTTNTVENGGSRTSSVSADNTITSNEEPTISSRTSDSSDNMSTKIQSDNKTSTSTNSQIDNKNNDSANKIDNSQNNQVNATEEPDIPAEQKYNITQKVLQAESDEEIADALQTLRNVGRFKGRKNLRRLLKAKRKNNQERIQKYEQKVNANAELTNERFKRKIEENA